MWLAETWFFLWALLWLVYFVVDGYTLGVGMVFPFLGKKDQEQRQMQEAIGPFWNGNEVWLITAGGATFAAFPLVYAQMFSKLYIPLYLILFALFYRAAGLEFMKKLEGGSWQTFWKWAFFTGSLLVSLLLGVAFANLFLGLEFSKEVYGVAFTSLLNAYGILGGLLFVTVMVQSGLLWLSAKVEGPLREKASTYSRYLWPAVLVVAGLFLAATGDRTTLLGNYLEHPVLFLIPALAVVGFLLVPYFQGRKLPWGAFFSHSLGFFLLMGTGFVGMFPRMLISRLDPSATITLYEAASSPLTQSIMLGVAVVMVPIVVGYQLWAYGLFRKPIKPEEAKGYS
ncbi:MAG: cytochrome d ubiquinol oxidase subunit II [Clostridiales bacterium]|nr:cytochrome d ubiquinol oxidase subunit II [Clostridiales bacterium]